MKFVFGVLAVFVAITATWAVWALLTPGDLLANGSALFFPSFAITAALALSLSIRRNNRAFRIGLVLSVALALAYWFLVPDGWWTAPPPRSPR